MNKTTENILNDTSEQAKQKSSQNKAKPSTRNLVKPLPFVYQAITASRVSQEDDRCNWQYIDLSRKPKTPTRGLRSTASEPR
jgi:hypothetical protein